MDINYELYKVFYYVATTLNFSEASRKLFISQSAVSQSIKTLEKKLGKPLFVRSTKSVHLTPEGETLFRHIEPAINLIKQGESDICDAGNLGGGQLRLAATDTICRYLLIPYLNAYHKKFPRVHIHITSQTSPKCVELLESGQVDLIITNYPNSRMGVHQDLHTIHEFHDVFACSLKHYPELEDRRLNLEDILEYPVLMLDRHSTTNEFLHKTFRKASLELVPEIELDSNDVLLDLAAIGLGLAFVPDYCLEHREDLFALDFSAIIPPRQVVIANSTVAPVTMAAQEFLSLFGIQKTAPAL